MTQKLRYFCTLLLMAVVGVAWADEESVVFSEQGYGNGVAVESYEGTNFSIAFNKGTNSNNAPKYYGTGSAIRAYGGNYFIVSSENTITKIELTFSSGEGSNAITTDVETYNNGTWEGSANEVKFTIGGTSGHRRIASVKVTYTAGDTDTPSISASNVNIDYDATEGDIAYTINNGVDGGVLNASVTDGDWLTLSGTNFESPIAFTCDANTVNAARTATVTLTYTYDNETVTKDVTVTQAAAPVIYTTIPDLFAAATSTATPVAITFNNWVISAVKGSNAYLTDNAGNGLIIYQSNHGFNVNDVLSGTASCNLVTYQGSAELTALTASTKGLTVTADGTVTEQNIAINELGGVNTGALLAYENLTFNGTALVDADNNAIEPYTTLYSGTFEADKVYNVKGIYKQYTTNTQDKKQILPRSADDIEEVVPTEPTVTVNPSAVEVDAAEHDGTITVSCENMGENLDISVFFCEETNVTTPAEYDWITAEIDNQNNVYYIIEANTATEARTAYMVVKVADTDAKEVYTSKLITFTQEAYVAPSYAVLPFSYNDGRANIEDTDGLTQEGLGTDYNVSSNPTTQLKFDGAGDWLLLQFDEEPGKLTFDIKGNGFSGGTFTVQTSVDGVTFTDLASYTELGNVETKKFDNLGANVRFIKWIYTNKSSGNVGLGNIKLEKPATSATITIKESFTATTFSCDKALDFTGQNIAAFIITDEKGTTTQVWKVPANTGLYIEGAAGNYDVPILADETQAEDMTGNLLVGTISEPVNTKTLEGDYTYYLFGKQNGKEAFFKVGESTPDAKATASAGKAYLAVPGAGNAKEMIVIGGDVTGIESIENGTIVNDNYYTIDGKLVKGQPTQKGIYVVNGRKVVIK